MSTAEPPNVLRHRIWRVLEAFETRLLWIYKRKSIPISLAGGPTSLLRDGLIGGAPATFYTVLVDHVYRLCTHKRNDTVTQLPVDVEDEGLVHRLCHLGVLMTTLEEESAIEYHLTTLQTSQPRHRCPVSTCSRDYKQVWDLHKHIRNDHTFLKPFIDKEFCYSCGLVFKSSRQLYFHDKTSHQENYKSRVQAFIPAMLQSNGEDFMFVLIVIDMVQIHKNSPN